MFLFHSGITKFNLLKTETLLNYIDQSYKTAEYISRKDRKGAAAQRIQKIVLYFTPVSQSSISLNRNIAEYISRKDRKEAAAQRIQKTVFISLRYHLIQYLENISS